MKNRRVDEPKNGKHPDFWTFKEFQGLGCQWAKVTTNLRPVTSCDFETLHFGIAALELLAAKDVITKNSTGTSQQTSPSSIL